MTSGTFASVAIASIVVNRGERQRRELEKIPELAASISRVGLINPPVVHHSDNTLVAGERRLEACKTLGWTDIPVQWAEDLPPHELRAIELEENIKRVDLSWQDQCRAVQEYHKLRTGLDPNWTQAMTAEALSYTAGAASHILTVASELEKGNERVATADKFSTARNIVARDAERRRDSILAIEKPAPASPILIADFNEWAKTYTGEPFNFLHCDFPYGINAENQDQGTQIQRLGDYKDDIEDYEKLLGSLTLNLDRLVAPSAHLIFWFSMKNYDITESALVGMGWSIDPFPLVWWKSDNAGLLPDPQRGPRRVYETAFFGHRGDRKVVMPVSNLVGTATSKDYHMSEKPTYALTHFFRMVVDEYTTMLDPTCGSGNALIVAKKLGASRVLGLEKDPTFAAGARENWEKNA